MISLLLSHLLLQQVDVKELTRQDLARAFAASLERHVHHERRRGANS